MLPLQPSCCLSGFVFELYKNNRCSSWNWYYANFLKKLPSRNFFTHPSSPFISCPSFLRIWSRLLQKSLIQKLHLMWMELISNKSGTNFKVMQFGLLVFSFHVAKTCRVYWYAFSNLKETRTTYPLSANPPKWSNSLKQFVGKGHFVGLAPKVLTIFHKN